MKDKIDVFHCPLYMATPHDEWDADSSLQLINTEAQRFLEQISKETDAAKKWNSEVTRALGPLTEDKEKEPKHLAEARLAMEATSLNLKCRVNMLEQMCHSLCESVQGLCEALLDAGINTAQQPLATSVPAPAPVLGLKDVRKVSAKSRLLRPSGFQFALPSSQPTRMQDEAHSVYIFPAHLAPALPERHSAPASLQLKQDLSSSNSSRSNEPQKARAAAVKVAGCDSKIRGAWSRADHVPLQHQQYGRGPLGMPRQLTESMTAMCNEIPAVRRPPLRRNTSSASLVGHERNLGTTARRATYQGPQGGSPFAEIAKEEDKGGLNDTARLGRSDSKAPAVRQPPLRRCTSLGGRLERSGAGFTARRATYQGSEGGILRNDVATEEHKGEVNDAPWLGHTDTKLSATRRPPLRRNATSASLVQRLEDSAKHFPARRATYQGSEGGKGLLNDVKEEEEEEGEGTAKDLSWQDVIAKRSLFSRRTESARDLEPTSSSWAAASARVR
ncbi:hypothetical protein DUNSADRAFT_18535 [Dunaliella salina]|uniref:Encoded protein n=1 Tax=Dunaliella salina TaxID=3046 RepID=A0ABQ7FZZ1_DUNSA|nr:hypothetical protein DUNSADRAFT_18535 [Dunaliella salina]KAF5827919.1 hypothetical protein DUNSADRAFT_18535 [Dunaliella salina]|eukprot:KAF5827918.1 hypothetical protein DUNSADRAFT_18535 [Dunaliella salina]